MGTFWINPIGIPESGKEISYLVKTGMRKITAKVARRLIPTSLAFHTFYLTPFPAGTAATKNPTPLTGRYIVDTMVSG